MMFIDGIFKTIEHIFVIDILYIKDKNVISKLRVHKAVILILK